MRTIVLAGLLLVGATACSSQHLDPKPPGVDYAHVPVLSLKVTAKKFEFLPAEIHVKAGTLVKLELQSIEGTHGFALDDFGLDVELEEGVAVPVEFYVPAPATHPFHCSHFCGSGHFGMKGHVVVE